MKKVVSLLAVMLAVSTIFVACAPGAATPPAKKPFYEGETITLIVATKPGGGFDTYGRLCAKYMEKYLPGSTIIVKNVPGAGHIIGTNEIYHAKPNGLTFGIFNRGLVLAQVAGLKGIEFDLAKMSWLGSSASDPRTWIASTKAPFSSLEDVKEKSDTEFIVASAGVGSSSYIDANLIKEILGLQNIQVATGYRGEEAELAMMRGEVHGQFASWSSMRPFVEEGHAVPILFTYDEPIKGWEDVPLLPDVAPEKYKGLVDFMLFQTVLNRPFAGPPGIPKDRLQILREAFKKSWHDPELLEQAERLGRPVNYIGGEKADKMVTSALKQPPEVVKLLKKSLGIK